MSDNAQNQQNSIRAIRNECNQQLQQDSIFFKFFSFLSLTDTEVLKECGKYDRTLVYAMVFRQLVTFAFTCMLFTYGVSMFLETTPSIITGIIFALTLFFLDQAIIGSDWALKNPFKGGLSLKSLFGLLPRIIYSLIIAIGLATLAEISLQANAIDEQTQYESNVKNRKYFSKLEDYEKELETSISVDRKKVANIQIEIQQLKEQKAYFETFSQENDNETTNNLLMIKKDNLSELQRSQKVLNTEIANINERIIKTRDEYNYWFSESLLERTGKDGRAPKEGPKYKRAVATYNDLQVQITVLENSLTNAKTKLNELKPKIEIATIDLNKVQQKHTKLLLSEANHEQNNTKIEQLQKDLLAAKTVLNNSIERKQNKQDEYRVKLVNDGLFYETKTGMLRRYLALKNIHKDPEIGQAALMFSLLLKIFFIAIELMPVIIKLFFSPFSFYSLKMYCKMHIALLEEQETLEAAKAQRKKARENRTKETGELDAINF
ncbi:DUF4407 domain-containing protein [Aliikangiella sp. IMCC44359]|uniref:DUF4407 domain-containing protein n=1 Tax=Aliikangiella sp. IMCC44359 TaxID=3459125 RepID=UPI00403B066E